MSNAPRLCDLHGPSGEPEKPEEKPRSKPKGKTRGPKVGASAATLGPEAARYREAGQRGEDRWRFFGSGETGPERLYGAEGMERLREAVEREDVRVSVEVRVAKK